MEAEILTSPGVAEMEAQEVVAVALEDVVFVDVRVSVVAGGLGERTASGADNVVPFKFVACVTILEVLNKSANLVTL